MNKEFWNERFAARDVYFYGKEPNPFFKEKIAELPKGKVLFAAEGEGRNAVYAAKLGFEVVAFDQSDLGRDKAMALAKEAGVKIEYVLTDLEGCAFEDASFDGLVMAFLHLPVDLRARYHRKMLSFVKPGGWVLLEGFEKKQIERNSGGPKDVSMLFSEMELRSDFEAMLSCEIQESYTCLEAGVGHVGDAFLIQMIGIR